jgi:hypothetical protein
MTQVSSSLETMETTVPSVTHYYWWEYTIWHSSVQFIWKYIEIHAWSRDPTLIQCWTLAFIHIAMWEIGTTQFCCYLQCKHESIKLEVWKGLNPAQPEISRVCNYLESRVTHKPVGRRWHLSSSRIGISLAPMSRRHIGPLSSNNQSSCGYVGRWLISMLLLQSDDDDDDDASYPEAIVK